MPTRTVCFATTLLCVVVGLVWRLVPMGLPVFALRHGGAILWGGMIFALVGTMRPPRWGIGPCFVAATIIVVAAELIRLYHAPALDAFRATLAGALLLGRVFSPWNILAYEVGVILAALALRVRAAA